MSTKIQNKYYFNSRPCERGFFFQPRFHAVGIHISIHAPARGASQLPWRIHSIRNHFNSRPCERGFEPVPDPCRNPVDISIHAPARGASDLPYGTTRCSYFNSRPCERGFFPVFYIPPAPSISIHAPARGASDAWEHSWESHVYFNSRPCERGFNFHILLILLQIPFQFTPLREGLQDVGCINNMQNLFQFTPLREGLLNRKPVYNGFLIFQFTPLREGLLMFQLHAYHTAYFNSRPCERGFFGIFQTPEAHVISIHAPARGASCKYSIGD